MSHHIRHYTSNISNITRASIVAIGNFDGLHMGHLELMNCLKSNATGLDKVVFSFCPHPTIAMSPNKEGFGLLLLSDEKRELLNSLGIDIFIEYPFDNALRNLTAEDFVKDILVGKLSARAVVMGSRSAFGKKRAGDVTLMRRMGTDLGFDVHEVKAVNIDTEVVSSTSIRGSVLSRDLQKACQMMTRPYQISGVVHQGKQLGRTLGFPTINICVPKEKLLPPNGVYLTKTKLPSGELAPSITNIGTNPSVADGVPEIHCETHIYDFNNTLYNSHVTIYFQKHIRGEIKFAIIEDLRTQVLADIEYGRSLIKNSHFME